MTYLSLFSGVGGGDYGFHCAGFRCVGQVEIVPFRRRVLEAHFPDVPRWDDITTFDPIARGWERPDAVLFGSPCQDLSVAGRRKGLEGSRSGLFFEAVRVLECLRPRWFVFENVPGLLSSNGGRDFLAVLDAVGQLGYGVAGRILDSRWFGVPQRRRRVWLVGCAGDPQRAGQVLFEPEGRAGHPAARNASGARVAASLTRGSAASRGVNAPGRRREDDENLVTATLTGSESERSRGRRAGGHDNKTLVAAPLAANRESGWRANGGEETFIPVARPLKAGGNDRQDGSHETYITVPSVTSYYGKGADSDATSPMVLARSLNAPHSPRYDGDTETFVVAPTMPFVKTARAHSAHDAERWADGAVSPTLNGWDSGKSRASALVAHALTAEGHDASEDGTGRGVPMAVQPAGVRRLTPEECEALQALPRGWTAVDGDRTPDSPRYAALGDAMTASVVQWIGERIIAAAEGERAK